MKSAVKQILRLAITWKYLAESHHKKQHWTLISQMTQSAWFSSDFLWMVITFSLWKCQLSTYKRNLVHNDQLSFEMSWHHWPWTFQWSLVNWRNAAWMGPLSSWIWSLENCPVEVLLRCFKGLMAWMWPGGSNWPLIMATSCQWVECCLNSRAVLFLCLRVSLQDFLSSNYSHLAISPCLIYMFLFFTGCFFFVRGVLLAPPKIENIIRNGPFPAWKVSDGTANLPKDRVFIWAGRTLG